MAASKSYPADCEICAVIQVLFAKNTKPVEIHSELRSVYGDSIIHSVVKKLCTLFCNGHTNSHDEQRSGQPSVISDDLV